MKKLLFSASLFSALMANSQILTENFEGGALPAGWSKTQSTPSVGWEFGANLSSQYWAVPSHTKYAASNDDAHDTQAATANLADKDRLITPPLDLTAQTAVALKFDAFYTGVYGSEATVEVSTNGGTTWTTIFTLDPSAAWQNNIATNLSAYAGQNNVLVAFRHNDGNAWADGFAIDNVSIYAPPANDAKINSIALNRYGVINTNSNLVLNVTNLGSSTISNLTIDWNDGTSHSQVINVSIAPFATMDVTHPTALNYSTAVEKTIAINITAVNGGVDADVSNNTGSKLFNSLSQSSPKKVVIEEGTGTWCGWCPRGAVAMEQMYQNHPNDFIGIAVHNGDPMTVTEYDNGTDLSGYPGCNVDRALLDESVSANLFESYYQERIGLAVPAGLSMTVSGTTSKTINVSATFRTVFASANYRLGVVIIEDNVTGTASGYNQTNSYAGGANGAMGGYESLPNPVPAASMVYDHVGRALLGGFAGQANSVPTTITDGLAASYTFNYTIPSTSNSANMSAVALLIDNATGEIVTAEKTSLSAANVNELETIGLNVYPNPASGAVNVSFEANNGDFVITLTDLQGRVISSKEMTNLNGSQVVTFSTEDVASGSYIVTVATNGTKTTKNVVIK
ncbi:MAG: Omp28-related outer membrane protein [Crocinitomicaceae bacterium]|jgi:thiol-disulfide isomerase/thioredoxin|nr:Omp28-related outer membrane protein [Crocinitomicaceae bacterium]